MNSNIFLSYLIKKFFSLVLGLRMSEYEACQHALTSASYSQVELARLKGLGRCGYCNFHGRNLWLCLEKDCGRVLCGDAESDHSTFHFKVISRTFIK